MAVLPSFNPDGATTQSTVSSIVAPIVEPIPPIYSSPVEPDVENPYNMGGLDMIEPNSKTMVVAEKNMTTFFWIQVRAVAFSGIVLLIALTWNKTFEMIFAKFVKERDRVIAQVIYAVLITIILFVLLYVIIVLGRRSGERAA